MSQMGSGDIKVQIGIMGDGVTHGGTQNEQNGPKNRPSYRDA